MKYDRRGVTKLEQSASGPSLSSSQPSTLVHLSFSSQNKLTTNEMVDTEKKEKKKRSYIFL